METQEKLLPQGRPTLLELDNYIGRVQRRLGNAQTALELLTTCHDILQHLKSERWDHGDLDGTLEAVEEEYQRAEKVARKRWSK